MYVKAYFASEKSQLFMQLYKAQAICSLSLTTDLTMLVFHLDNSPRAQGDTERMQQSRRATFDKKNKKNNRYGFLPYMVLPQNQILLCNPHKHACMYALGVGGMNGIQYILQHTLHCSLIIAIVILRQSWCNSDNGN